MAYIRYNRTLAMTQLFDETIALNAFKAPLENILISENSRLGENKALVLVLVED
jgi:hypothetical protein